MNWIVLLCGVIGFASGFILVFGYKDRNPIYYILLAISFMALLIGLFSFKTINVINSCSAIILAVVAFVDLIISPRKRRDIRKNLFVKKYLDKFSDDYLKGYSDAIRDMDKNDL